MGIDRRTFIKGSALFGGAAVAGGLFGCSPGGQNTSNGQGGTSTANVGSNGSEYASRVTETRDVDVLVVGEGISGLSAGVTAAEAGLKTTIIDTIQTLERRGPEGIFGVGSTLQKNQGIAIDPADIIARETLFFNYRLDALTWKDMIGASGANIDWLAEKGVEFTGQVDNYRNMGEFECFHWFPGDHVAWQYYSTPMEKAFLGYGNTEVLLETTAVELIMDGNVVVGAYATSPSGIIQFNTKAIIFATGGCGGSKEEIAKRFQTLPLGRYYCDGYPTNDGSGLNMALAAGGVDVTTARCMLAHIDGWAKVSDLNRLAQPMNGIWVNQNGERFTDESINTRFAGAAMNAMMAQYNSHSVMDAEIVQANDTRQDGLLDIAIKDAADGDPEFFSADTIEGLAAKIKVDAATLKATVDEYNALCDAGVDSVFKKDARFLMKIQTPPFFAGHQFVNAHGMVGGLLVNRNFQVLRWDNTPIAGLYAVGTESNMNYRETYTIEVPGTDFGNCVYSGRRAAQHIAKQ